MHVLGSNGPQRGHGTFPARATLNNVKSLRVWLFVLLAFALPMRGAMAAAMLCAPAPTHATASAAHVHEHAGHADAAAHATAAHDHGSHAGDDASDKCGFCATCCSVTFPVALTFTLPQAPPAAAAFPESPTPAAEFFSGGQERPPRST